jgi:hypothetical protein
MISDCLEKDSNLVLSECESRSLLLRRTSGYELCYVLKKQRFEGII